MVNESGSLIIDCLIFFCKRVNSFKVSKENLNSEDVSLDIAYLAQRFAAKSSAGLDAHHFQYCYIEYSFSLIFPHHPALLLRCC